jgi:hypothetical protein
LCVVEPVKAALVLQVQIFIALAKLGLGGWSNALTAIFETIFS